MGARPIPPGEDPVIYERFAKALRQAMAANHWSERQLAKQLHITIGTTHKYFRSGVHPLRVATEINRNLARVLGITLDALVHFYETGEYENQLSFNEVISWVRSSAGMEHIGPILEAMSSATNKKSDLAGMEPYTWPREELDQAEVPQRLRERMGLTQEVLDGLEKHGVFDDELVEAFSVATNLEEDAVRDAFTKRRRVE